ncbi:phosphate acyltransferase PlsX [Desulfurispirillum indicum]|uniref:Phosphate acyltransferase n=1 Tax=Desulfurispirillum indicum (strain ATCC BAA-1389 / DSM 22839 / S5) TaxID=653733 RepID=E6W0Z9_DESIS|nr:phosphate acyltransferase PlsX [Desulfurispirillum indicum]ADU65331.1 fatty acid/phospholipid synthesis protein PlsX [Desulfurispirillum indicum S5]UCZ57227.1 phosphate acyltransferase PlsX [Desulfurispirillum indicum]
MHRIVIDVMGGDFAPQNPIEGAVLALEEYQDIEICLVGPEQVIAQELQRYPDCPRERLRIVHASEYITMEEAPGIALRRKKDSSIRVGLELVKKGEADAFISAGNTGAVMGGSLLYLKTMPGVAKAAIATFLPTLSGTSIMLDVGANVDCRPEHILQFALMGNSYARYVLNKPAPTVGILSIGEEDSKGNDITRQTFRLLNECSLIDFRGNVEGKEVYKGVVDVIACDGFTGNIALKVSESLAYMISTMLKEELGRGWFNKLGAVLSVKALKRLKKRLDYTEYGGAPLLGVNGAVFISHGSSSPQALKNAFRAARIYVERGVNQHIYDDITKTFAQLNHIENNGQV